MLLTSAAVAAAAADTAAAAADTAEVEFGVAALVSDVGAQES